MKRTVLLRGKKKSMKSPCFVIGVLQQPNVFKSKHSLPNEITEGVRTGSWVSELSEEAEL